METQRICPACQKPLAADAPRGLCPECLMKAGFGTGVAPEPGQPSRNPGFVPPPAAEVARLFPQFEILELLGQGGMGAVYKARQKALDRLVALKILPPQASAEPGFADRFTREARALARLNHPNIVAVHEFGQTGGLHYFVMEYVEGLNLRQLELAGKLAPREALKIIPQICDALQFAHDAGIVHRDIKPENVMLDTRGRVKITDFGLARILGREPEAFRLTGAKDVMGTPHYMAPEQVEHPQEVDHRADIYSLGVVFYEMLTGELPLGKFAPPSRKVQVDVRLDEVVLHALEKEPQRRYQQASQVKTDVETIATSGSGNAPGAQAAHWTARFSPTAIWGAVWAPLWCILGLVFFREYLLPIGVAAMVGTTLLGVIAIIQIRHAQGRLYGLGLAVVEALLVPLLAANGLIVAARDYAAHELADALIPYLGRVPFTILMFAALGAICVTANWFLIRLVWRLAHLPADADRGGTAVPGATPRPLEAATFLGRWWAVGAAAGLVLVAGLLTWGLQHRSSPVSPDSVVRVEEQLRQAILARLAEAGWRVEGLSVNVAPDLKRAECHFGRAIEHNTIETPFVASIGITPQGQGLWLVAGTGRFDFLHFSVNTSTDVLEGDPSQAPASLAADAPEAARFRTVHILVLNDMDEARGSDALDFDQEQVLDLPKDLKRQPASESQRWLRERNVDLLLDHTRERWGLLTPLANELKLVPLGNESWDTATAASLAQALAAGPGRLETIQRGPWLVYVLPTNSPPPWTFALQTAGGSRGVMQIAALPDATNSVRLQYKLLRADSPQESGDFVAVHRLELAQQALDAAHHFVEEHQWQMQSESRSEARAVFKVTDTTGKGIEFEELSLPASLARFSIRTEPGAELPARTIGAALWRRLGWLPLGGAALDQSKRPTVPPVAPVVERVLYSVDAQQPIKAEDLDKGQEMEVPSELAKAGEKAFFAWLATQGADLMAFAHQRSWDLWAAPKLVSVPVTYWEQFSGLDLLVALKTGHLDLKRAEPNAQEGFVSYRVETNAAFPLTFAFQTSAGGVGLLQLLGLTENPRGLEIRYKVPLKVSPGATPGLSPGATGAGLEGSAGKSLEGEKAPAPSVPVPIARAKPGEYKVTLTNGVEFEVLAIASSPRSGGVWWRPDGKLLPVAPGDHLQFPMGNVEGGGGGGGGSSRTEFAVLIRATGAAAERGELPVTFDPRPQMQETATLLRSNTPVGPVAVIGFRSAPEKLACRVGLLQGGWQRVAMWDHAGTLLTSGNTNVHAFRRKTVAQGEELILLHNIDPNQFQVRLVARLKNGEHPVAEILQTQFGSGTTANAVARLQALGPDEVVAYELYQAPVVWVEIPNLATKPNVPPL